MFAESRKIHVRPELLLAILENSAEGASKLFIYIYILEDQIIPGRVDDHIFQHPNLHAGQEAIFRTRKTTDLKKKLIKRVNWCAQRTYSLILNPTLFINFALSYIHPFSFTANFTYEFFALHLCFFKESKRIFC